MTLWFVLAVAAAPVSGAVIHVLTSGNDGESGLTWSQAKETIQAAIDAAGAGDEVWVGEGTYPELIRMAGGVNLLGGFDGTETDASQQDPVAHVVVIDGSGFTGPRHVVSGADALIDGFTIKGGDANNEDGGGMINDGVSPTVRRCIFKENEAKQGGGVFNRNAAPSFSDSVFKENDAKEGGGMFNQNASPSLIRCRFVENTAKDGGGLYNAGSDPVLDAVLFRENTADAYGGGIYNDDTSDPTLTDVDFSENTAKKGGDDIWPPPDPDTTPPRIDATTPPRDETDVEVNVTVTARLSEPVDPDTVDAASFLLADDAGPVAGTVDYSGTTASFAPTDPLRHNTRYTATITTDVRDLAGNPLAADYTWSFETGERADDIPPGVSATRPENNETDVERSAVLAATFTEPVKAPTVTTESFLLSDGAAPVPGTIDYSGVTATFTPERELLPATQYTATVTSDVEDLAGNPLAVDYTWSFTTGERADDTPPAVGAVHPRNDAADVERSAVLAATFTEPVRPATVTAATFVVDNGTAPVPGTVDYSGTTATFTPNRELLPGTRYTATVTANVRDLAGNPLAADYIWSFTTGERVDDIPPAVSATQPEEGATDVDRNGRITATFTEPVKPATVTTATFLVDNGSAPVAGTVDYSGTTATFTPNRELLPGIRYTARVTTRVRDLAGNPLPADYVWGFTTAAPPRDQLAPFVRFTTPVDGADEVAVDAEISATFSEPLDPASVTQATFLLMEDTEPVQGYRSAAGSRIYFVPAEPLRDGAAYTATIKSAVRDEAGNYMENDYIWRFTTAAAGENRPPERPSLLSPPDEGVLDPGGVVLAGGPYADPEDDPHLESRWVVRRWDRPHAERGTPDLYEHLSTAGDLTQHAPPDLQEGMKYVWKLGYTDSGSRETAWSAESTFKIGRSISRSYPIPQGSALADYRMISFSQWPDQPVDGLSIAGDETAIRFGTYDPLVGDYVQIGEGLHLKPGTAYWILSGEETSISVSGVPVTLAADIDVPLGYDAATGNGWNMIGPPNAADYFWEDIRVLARDAEGEVVFGPTPVSALAENNPYLDRTLWRWDQGIYESETYWLESGGGYWIRTRSSGVVLRFPEAARQPAAGGEMLLARALNGGRKLLASSLFPSKAAVARTGEDPPLPMAEGERGFGSSESESCFIGAASHAR